MKKIYLNIVGAIFFSAVSNISLGLDINKLSELGEHQKVLLKKIIEVPKISFEKNDKVSVEKNRLIDYSINNESVFNTEFFLTDSKDNKKQDNKFNKFSQMITFAKEYIGIKYKFAGNSKKEGFDCSGYVKEVFEKSLGLYLPRTSHEMSEIGQKINKINQLKPGDLVFFNTMRKKNSHVGIYLGDNQFLHAPRTGKNITIEDMSADYWVNRFNGASRINYELPKFDYTLKSSSIDKKQN